MTFHWGEVGILVVGLVLVFAPLIGELWSRDFRGRACVVCGRELVGSPPAHKLSDRDYCRDVARWGK